MPNPNNVSFSSKLVAEAKSDPEILAAAAAETMALRYLTQIEDTP